MLPLHTFTSNPSRYSFLSMLVGEGGLNVRTGIPYGPGPRQALDVYSSRTAASHGPVALFLYGGSWRGGSRSCYGFVGAALASHGVTTAIADYRLFPQVRWPDFQADAAAALQWVQRELATDHTRPVLVIGHSAGAHMAALLALDPRWHRASRPAGVVGLSGPYSFEPTIWPTTRDIFVTARHPDEPRPVAQVTPDAPPMLLLHGAADTTVKPHNMQELAEALRRSNVPVETHLLPDSDHKATVLGFARPFRRRYAVLEKTLAFARRLAPAATVRS